MIALMQSSDSRMRLIASRGHDELAVADLAEHVLAGMRHGLEPRQAEEAASTLDGVDEPEDVAEKRRIVRILLEPDELEIEHRQVLGRFGQKFTEEIVHGRVLGQVRRGQTPHDAHGRWTPRH